MDWKIVIEGFVFTHTYSIVMILIVARLANSFLKIIEEL